MEEQKITRRRRRRRIVLVPAPAQGHITPMMQLAKTLYLKGFLISIAQGQFNTLSSSSSQNFLDFDFFTIPESLPESELQRLGPPEFLMKLSKISEESFKNCICELMKQHDNDIACIVYDELMYFSEAAAQEFKIPSFIFCTWSATNQACCSVLTKFDAEKFLIDMEDPKEQEKEIEEFHPLKYKDLPTSGLGPVKGLLNFLKQIVNKRTASAMIINTVKSLENSSLSWLEKELKLPVYPLGPLHITVSSHSSLMEEDRSCIEWLNKQKPNSVIYISVGSLAFIETNEVLEMAWGLCNSNIPFLWVIRPGSIPGSDWIESLPKEVSEKVTERGQIVKWVPQIEVLEHPAVGGFLSHCGWNSILESIAAGVPLICRPFQGEQKLNARCLESVWRIGIQLEGEVEREEVKRAVKMLMIDEEGVGMKERAVCLKEKFKAAVRSGGSSYTAIDEFVKNLKRE